ncbi:MBL fold metallo-hydrolase [Treponema sp.]|uniref:MBL fold metallo-hydrolase n=1 Tax=Treponema sp. TaxID=166 RepID=UPI0025CD235E|nr:MBL fold metallo-hydrolase [Treponema sp.]MCR5217928.1 MBL fold metallo-hydrolase [Treponema sp.]
MISIIHTGPYGVNTLIVPLAGPYVFVTDPACCSLCGDEHAVTSYLNSHSLIPLAFVLTHGHYDHIAGISVMKKAWPDVPLLIHENDRERIGPASLDFQEQDLAQAGLSMISDAYKNLPDCDACLKDGQNLFDAVKDSGCNCLPQDNELHEALKNWQVIWTPGHTMGCICLYNKITNELISGDTIFYGAWGRTDLKGGSEELMINSLRKIHEIIPLTAKVYPGHDYCGFELKEFFG